MADERQQTSLSGSTEPNPFRRSGAGQAGTTQTGSGQTGTNQAASGQMNTGQMNAGQMGSSTRRDSTEQGTQPQHRDPLGYGTRQQMDSMNRNAQSMVEHQQSAVRSAAEQMEKAGHQAGQMIHERIEDMQTVMRWPTVSSEALPDYLNGIAGTANHVMRGYVRALQDLYHLAGPAAYVEVQQRFAGECFDAFVKGGMALARTTQEAMNKQFSQLEHRVARRQQSHDGQSNGHQAHRDGGRVTDIMRKSVPTAAPDDTVQHAARIMREADIGALPVGEGDRLVGMVTDRDVTLRLVAAGKDAAQTKVREVMTSDPHYAFEDDELDHVVDDMAEHNLQRLPIVSRDKRLVGIVSIRDLARGGQGHHLGHVMGGQSHGSQSRGGQNHGGQNHGGGRPVHTAA
jgi:CBS domain-containing protein